MSGDIEKLIKSFGYIKSCMVLGSDGEVSGYELDNQEELAFKLSVLFDLGGLEEIMIEKEGGACYLKLFDNKLIYLDCNKKPNVALLNMYLKRIFPEESVDGEKAEKDKKEEEQKEKEEELRKRAEERRREEERRKREREEWDEMRDTMRL